MLDHTSGNEHAEVAALDDVPFVAELLHQGVTDVAMGGVIEAIVVGGGREAEIQEGRSDNVECGLRGIVRINEARQDLGDFKKVSGPAMEKEEWNGIGVAGPCVDEVDIVGFRVGAWVGKSGGKLWKGGVKGVLSRAPGVGGLPVVEDTFDVREGYTAGPGLSTIYVGRKLCQREFLLEAVKTVLRNADLVRFGFCHG